MPRVIELFAGVGGFRVGLNHITDFDKETGRAIENGRWNFVWANQWEPSTKVQHAFNCYTTRFGESEYHENTDIALKVKSQIDDHELLVGGFPCQDYSVARTLSSNAGITGKKGVLWWQIHEIIKVKQTPFILLENVDRLLKSPASNRGRDFSIMLKSLDELGYIVEWRVINAAEYGMPQKRRRVFIFAYKKNSKRGKEILKGYEGNISSILFDKTLFNSNFKSNPDGEIQEKNLNLFSDTVDITDNYGSEQKKYENTGILINGIAYHSRLTEVKENEHTLGQVITNAYDPSIKYSDYIVKDVSKWKELKGAKSIDRVSKSGHKYKYSEGNMAFPDKIDSPGRTMLTSESTTNRSSHIIAFDEKKEIYRTITEAEAELLNMFPHNWTNTGMPKRARYFMMGNALVTGILSRIESDLFSIITKE